MLYEKSTQPKLSEELFKKPTSEYRGAPFWSWNCKVTKELIDEQIAMYEEMGVGGVTAHCRTGLETPYMSEEFLELMRYCDEQAKKRGMRLHLYDEDRYASGAAGGMVTENVRFRQRFLLLSRKEQPELCDSRKAYEAAADAGEKPKGYYVTSYLVKLDSNGCLEEYKRMGKEEALACAENLQQGTEGAEPSGTQKVWHAYVKTAKESPWFNDQTYVDVFKKEAIDAFMEVTHKRYFEALGEDFGKSVPSIFTDEPQMAGKFAFATPFDDRDATLSYTDDMNETYQAKTGVELLAIVPEILWELPGGEISQYRYLYHDHLAERFAEAFPDNIAKWCGEHHIALTGHYMSERTLYSQTLALSEAMRLYQSMQMPGIDILCDAKEFTTAKQAVSVARQQGREGVASELYGVTHWDADFKTYKLQGDWQAALGVTHRVHHLTFMSMEGEAKRDWPASFGYQSPWYQKFPYVEEHFARLNTALTRGRANVNLAVIHPIESYWISYGPNSQTQLQRDQLDANFEQLTQWLLYGTVDFDFISESLLPSQCPALPESDELKVGEMIYRTVLIPDVRSLRSTTLERLEAFEKAGGQVIFAGAIPEFVDGKRSEQARRLAQKCTHVEFNRAAILEALESTRQVEIRDNKGRMSDNLIYQLRQDGEGKWLFVCHVNRKTNLPEKHEKYVIKVKGCWNPVLYDTITGEIRPVKGLYEVGKGSPTAKETDGTKDKAEDGYTAIKMHMFAEDSLLLYLEPKMPEEVAESPARKYQSVTLSDISSYDLTEPNVLLLDYAEYKFDDGEWQERKDILTIDNEFRLKLGLPRRQDHFTQPWRIPNVPTENTAYLKFVFDSDRKVAGASLAMERPEKAKIFLNGQPVDNKATGYYVDKFIKTVALPEIQAGKNELLLEIPFGRKENLEWCYILGDFGVTVYGDHAKITNKPERLLFGDITRQGLPFYTGNIRYELQAELSEDTEEAVLSIPHFAAPVLEVFADGENKGIVAYAPHKISLGAMKAGSHKIEIFMYGNRFNGFGTLHNADEKFQWYGPDSYRTKGSQWSDTYQLRPLGVLSKVELLLG